MRELLLLYKEVAIQRAIKKPKSVVRCDINPELVGSLSDILAIPLTHIINGVSWGDSWSNLWKLETITIIPKQRNPLRRAKTLVARRYFQNF